MRAWSCFVRMKVFGTCITKRCRCLTVSLTLPMLSWAALQQAFGCAALCPPDVRDVGRNDRRSPSADTTAEVRSVIPTAGRRQRRSHCHAANEACRLHPSETGFVRGEASILCEPEAVAAGLGAARPPRLEAVRVRLGGRSPPTQRVGGVRVRPAEDSARRSAQLLRVDRCMWPVF